MSSLVVVGLGYVGMPLAQEACAVGLATTGLDVSEQVVARLNDGGSHIDDLSDRDVKEMLRGGFQATTDFSVVAGADSVVICVPTPLAPGGGPDLACVEAACRSIAPHLTAGTLVVLESTTYPGTTAEVVGCLLQAGSGLVPDEGFLLAFSPERIDPGNAVHGFRNTPKIVGADGPRAKRAVVALYRQLVDQVVEAKGTREAEAAKLLENTYRHVNIALVNEMAVFFNELDIDFWDVIDLAASKPFGFQPFRPGPGVGGHCIPIDPNYLAFRVKSELGYTFRLVELATEINASMPSYVASRAMHLLNDHGKATRGAAILLLGVAYKPNISDTRETPALPLARRLESLGARVEFWDPHVEESFHGFRRAVDLSVALRSADLTILLQPHDVFDLPAIEESAALLLDTRGVTSGRRSHLL